LAKRGRGRGHVKARKGKAEHLYSALHGIQTTLKRSDMDHTIFYLQQTPSYQTYLSNIGTPLILDPVSGKAEDTNL